MDRSDVMRQPALTPSSAPPLPAGYSADVPTEAVRRLATAMLTPRPAQGPVHTPPSLMDARRIAIPHRGGPLPGWQVGIGPQVVLVHGWDSRAADLAGWIAPLRALGCSVTLYDAPGHGEAPGHRCHVFEMAAALRSVVDAVGPVAAVVGHSAGSAAALIAFSEGLTVDASVHLAGPSSLTDALRGFARAHGLAGADIDAFVRAVEADVGRPAADADLTALAPALRHRALIVHDRDDRQVPWQAAAALHAAWPGSRLSTTRGLGHRRLLDDPAVVDEVAGFLAAGRAEASR